jgi:hypothetical protein
VVNHTLENSRTDQINVLLGSYRQSGIISQLVEAYTHGKLANNAWLELANNAFYLITSAVFQCMEYH